MDYQKELVAEFDRETALTRKMLEAIPADADFNWKANPKSMTLGRLATHVGEINGEWGRETLAKDEVMMDMATYKPFLATNKAELLEKFDADVPETRKLLADLDPAKWDERWKMGAGGQVWIEDSRYAVFRNWVLNHMVHHRAQLGRDLRTLGVPIPGTYGPSGDEM